MSVLLPLLIWLTLLYCQLIQNILTYHIFHYFGQAFQRGIYVYFCMLYEYLFLLSGFTSAIFNLLE